MQLKLVLACVGKLGRGPEADLVARYETRLPWPCTLREIPESRAETVDQRRAEEAARLDKAVTGCRRRLVLDERGKSLSSRDLQAVLRRWSEAGETDIAALIGGPDGLDPALVDRADCVLSLGRLTWPHKLVRVMLLEQLYRQWSIAAGHPYHRD
ncbi:MAG: 23S rRNA (pseudouridine(1915)-N(3))-methyltransferase RlmH [Rhodothalassiaceae bacterium]